MRHGAPAAAAARAAPKAPHIAVHRSVSHGGSLASSQLHRVQFCLMGMLSIMLASAVYLYNRILSIEVQSRETQQRSQLVRAPA